jgi:hypothetical protein
VDHDARCDETLAEDRDANELVIAEYAAEGRALVDDTDEVLLLRTD